MAKRRPPDIESIKAIGYLTKTDIMRTCHVGRPVANQIWQACSAMTKKAGYETLTGRIRYTRLLDYLGVEE